MAADQLDNSRCRKCDMSDTAEMINCELCGRKEHLVCAGVPDGFLANNSTWACQQCNVEKNAANAAKSVRSSTSSRRSMRLKLALEELEVKNRLRMKEIEAEKEFYKQKYELLKQFEDDDDRDSRRSVVSEKSRRERLESWLAKNPNAAAGIAPADDNPSKSLQHDVTNQQLEIPPQSSSTPSNQTSGKIPPRTVADAVNQQSGLVSSLQPLNNSGLQGTILTPADMDVTVNRTVASESLHPVAPVVSIEAPSSSAAICFSTSVAFTSSNLAESVSAAQQRGITSQGLVSSRFQSITGQQGATGVIQKASNSVPYSSQWDASQTTTGGVFPEAPIMPPYQGNVSSVPVRSCAQSTTWIPQRNFVEQSTQVGYQQPAGTFPMPQVNSTHFGSQFCRDLGNALPSSSVQSSAPQMASAHPATGQFSVVQLVPPHMVPPQHPSNWSAQLPGSTVQPQVQFRSPVVGPTAAIPAAEFHSNAATRAAVTTAEQSHAAPVTSHAVPPPAAQSFAARPVASHVPQINSGILRHAGPTASQLAARQVISRDLPTFSGNPEDWPIFFSSFQNSTDTCGYSDAENLARLQRCLKGSALEAVRSRLLLPASVPNVMETLHKLYGKPENLINSLLKKVRNAPPPKADNLHSIIAFGLAVQNLVDHIVIAEQDSHLANPMLLQELVGKLPTSLKLQWGTFKRAFANVDLTTFNEFMVGMVDLASDLSLNVDATGGDKPQREDRGRHKEKLFVHSQDEPSGAQKKPDKAQSDQPRSCSNCGASGHQILQCTSFKSLTVEERWKVIRQKNLCRSCLIPHRKWPCRSKKECGKDGCTMKHHSLLHESQKSQSQHSKSPATANPSTSSQVAHQNHHFDQSYSLFRYVPVTIYGNGKQVDIFAFLDEGSSTTMIETGVSDQLDVDGPTESLWLTWTGEISREEKKSRIISITVAGVGLNQKFSIGNVRTVRDLKLPIQSFCYETMAEQYPHLKGLPIKSYECVTPRMIIGLEHVRLLTAQKLREGNGEGPVAIKTRLGWSVFGRQTENQLTVERVNFHYADTFSNLALHDSMKQFFLVEECVVTKKLEAEEDIRAQQLLEQTTVRKGSRFETGLLWKIDNPSLPNSLPMAKQRLKSLERKLARDPGLRQRVKDQIDSYVEKGYAHRASKEELQATDENHTWYLPLGVVENPKKPGKTRLIWDAAAKVQGVSLNDLLLKGPDLLKSLSAVLLRFRQHNIAVCGDIAEMFHQVRIKEGDKQFQRFLWRDDPNDEEQVFVMDVATFGATCSPCIAQYIKNRNALEFAESHPRAVEGIIENHYVDDFLDSVETEEEAVELVESVKRIHAAAGFQIGKFQSNSSTVLAQLGEPIKSETKSLNLDKEGANERVLGMVWSPTADVFTFDTAALPSIQQLAESRAVPTKRQVLRAVMTLFDPLGLIAHYIVHGKILMQDIWRSGSGWDEPIDETLHKKWNRWITLLNNLSEVQVPRCFFRGEKLEGLQLHVFVDASENAYAAVAYLRLDTGTERKFALVEAKTKVSPVKPLSIPRLELQAAMLGARLAQKIGSSLTLAIERRYFWSDASTVLSWLRSERRRYHQFVEFRVAEILSLTCIDEWRYVPSKLNVADEATKWREEEGPSFQPDQQWYQGPAFLYGPEEEWPVMKRAVSETTEELRPMFLHREKVMQSTFELSRFSNWNRLLRTAAYVYRAISMFKKRRTTRSNYRILQKEEFSKAEAAIMRQIQAEAYPDEVAILSCGNEEETIPKSSPLYTLSPFLDPEGVIRLGSRTEDAPEIPYNAKYPTILPKNHIGTLLLVDSFHRKFLHANGETVHNEIRQQYFIPSLRTVIRRVARDCQLCKVKKAVPRPPMMAPLPRVRLTPFIRAFTFVGVDYFGPLEVKVGRATDKRWVALFTCLSIRAIHLEVVHSLSTESCVMAFRRFVARRGAPAEVYSDNATNFVGASRQLSEEIRAINEECAATFTNAHTTWKFNVPAAPHMGGPWERMVRSVKTGMKAITESTRHPNDEVLLTILLEVEAVVNSRPLTYVPLGSAEQEALTPNHFLLYGSNGIKQPATLPVDSGMALRKSHKFAQHLVDGFWQRWVKEYLPMLSRRSKWFDAVKQIQPGDIVIVMDEKVKSSWMKGRVLETTKGKGGHVRSAKVQTTRGIFSRPAVKLAVLDVKQRCEEDPEDESTVSAVVHGVGDVVAPTVRNDKSVKAVKQPADPSCTD